MESSHYLTGTLQNGRAANLLDALRMRTRLLVVYLIISIESTVYGRSLQAAY
jgi:hypothetical protein